MTERPPPPEPTDPAIWGTSASSGGTEVPQNGAEADPEDGRAGPSGEPAGPTGPEPVTESEATVAMPEPPRPPEPPDEATVAMPEPPRAQEPPDEATVSMPEPPSLGSDEPRRGVLQRIASADRKLVVLAATSCVLAVLVVLLALMVFAPRMAPLKLGATRVAAEAQEEQEIVALAERFAANFLTIDHETIDADFERLTADATGSFRDQLDRVLEVTRTQFRERRASSRGEVSDSLLLSSREGTALVRVVVERTITNAATDGTQTGAQVLDVTLVQTTGGWRVDNMQQLQGPTGTDDEG